MRTLPTSLVDIDLSALVANKCRLDTLPIGMTEFRNLPTTQFSSTWLSPLLQTTSCNHHPTKFCFGSVITASISNNRLHGLAGNLQNLQISWEEREAQHKGNGNTSTPRTVRRNLRSWWYSSKWIIGRDYKYRPNNVALFGGYSLTFFHHQQQQPRYRCLRK